MPALRVAQESPRLGGARHASRLLQSEGVPVAARQLSQRPLPRALAHRGQRRIGQPASAGGIGRQLDHGRGQRVRPGRTQEPRPPILDQVGGAALVDATTGRPLACASRITCPNVSVRPANRNRSGLA